MLVMKSAEKEVYQYILAQEKAERARVFSPHTPLFFQFKTLGVQILIVNPAESDEVIRFRCVVPFQDTVASCR